MESSTMIFYYMACILFACFVAYTYMRIAYTGAKSTRFNMEFFVNDVGLMTDTIYAVPGDVDYDYGKKPSKFIFDFRNGGLFVYTPVESASVNIDQSNISSKWSSYTYLFRTEKPVIKRFIFPPIISFKKKGSMLDISSTGTFNEREFCPEFDTAADIRQINITIDPGRSESFFGYDDREYFLVQAIAQSMYMLCRSHSMNCKVLMQRTTAEKMAERDIEPKPDMLISLHIGNYNNPADMPFKTAYILGSSKSEKLSCLISNQFRKDYIVLEGEQIIPFMKFTRDYALLLPKDMPSVVLEIGNIKNTINFGQADDMNNIAAAIIKGIEEYYKKSEAISEGEGELEGVLDEDAGGGEPVNPAGEGKVNVIVR